MSYQYLLVLEDEKGQREYPLSNEHYIISCNPHSDIFLHSRNPLVPQALLIRQTAWNGSHFYKLINNSDLPILINEQEILQVYHLQNLDEITFSDTIKATYYTNNSMTTQITSNPGLFVKSPEGEQLSFPLKHTAVSAKVAGSLSRVEVIQTFKNPFTKPLEAIYVFPLPDEAAVDDMEIKIGDRIIKGNIKKREEAQAIYQQAKRQGRTAGLLEQERDNIFTQSLANIKPGEQIDVTIRYTDSLKFTGGDYEFVFPMVVGPRFIPGTPLDSSGDTDEVPDASRITPPIMPEGMRSGHDINITVEINAGVPIQDIRSPSHQLRIEPQGEITRVQLGGEDTIPNKDLILRYRIAGDNTQATVLTQADERGGHFAIYLIPALQYRTDEIVPKDVVFLIDTSGSQMGAPLQQCQELMRHFIQGLNAQDTFAILDFSETTRKLSETPLTYTPQNCKKALDYINQLQADGGTYLLNGLQTVLKFPASPPGRLRSIVLLTDGYIGNETQILAEVQDNLPVGQRLYSFGAGSSVNRFLLNRIAEIGRGISQIIRHDEPVQTAVDQFFRQINNPVLTNLQITWEGEGETPIIYPASPPDLFAEQPLVLFGRKQDGMAGKLTVRGDSAGSQAYEQAFNLNFDLNGNIAIAQLWGRARIKDLMNQMLSYETTTGVEAVTETALSYQLLSQYTAFVAVSDDLRVEPESEFLSLNVPVEMPEAVSYEGCFASAPQAFDAALSVRAYGYIPPRFQASHQLSFSESEALELVDSEDEELGLIDPNVLEEARPLAKSIFHSPGSPQPISTRLQILKAEGLDAAATQALTHYLQQLHFSETANGELIFEFIAQNQRVKQLVFNEVLCTLENKKVIQLIKKHLLAWKVPPSISGKVIVTLQVQ